MNHDPIGDCNVVHLWKGVRRTDAVAYERCRRCGKRRFWILYWSLEARRDKVVEIDWSWLQDGRWTIHGSR